jgi:hypothetical protein
MEKGAVMMLVEYVVSGDVFWYFAIDDFSVILKKELGFEDFGLRLIFCVLYIYPLIRVQITTG